MYACSIEQPAAPSAEPGSQPETVSSNPVPPSPPPTSPVSPLLCLLFLLHLLPYLLLLILMSYNYRHRYFIKKWKLKYLIEKHET